MTSTSSSLVELLRFDRRSTCAVPSSRGDRGNFDLSEALANWCRTNVLVSPLPHLGLFDAPFPDAVLRDIRVEIPFSSLGSPSVEDSCIFTSDCKAWSIA